MNTSAQAAILEKIFGGAVEAGKSDASGVPAIGEPADASSAGRTFGAVWITSRLFTAGSITMSSIKVGTLPFFSVSVVIVKRCSARVNAT